MNNKRGQFFIIAAVVISAVLVGLVLTKNYVYTQDTPERITSLTEDINDESMRVIDYGVYNEGDLSAKMENFSKVMNTYLSDAAPNTNFIFIYRNKTSLTIRNYGVNASLASYPIQDCAKATFSRIGFGSLASTTATGTWEDSRNCVNVLEITDKDLVITINGKDVTFPISENRYFGFLLKLDKGENTYVITQK